MSNLTPLEKTRISLIAITLLGPLATAGVALAKWRSEVEDGLLPYPLQTALLNIVSAYMPILIIIFGFLWTLGKRPKPPKGDAVMDLTAHVVAVFVFAVTMGIPILIYSLVGGDDANLSMVLYSSLMHTLLSAAMIYYFGKPLVDEHGAEPDAAATPAAK